MSDLPLKQWLLSAVALLSSALSPAWAQGEVKARLDMYTVSTDQSGQETLSPAVQVRPGETVEYRAVYTNTGKSDVKGMEATLPIPAGAMAYLSDSGRPSGVLASLDGKTFAPAPLKRMVKAANGRQELQAVPPGEYRYLRWQVGQLAAGQSVTVAARMKLVEDARASSGAVRGEARP